ncbi:hypothetical protein KKH27_03330 [bacterium]|nr:hypothetical protein [bacterium]MBU1983936.1 hypothetical protein [bacterium]
MYHTISIALFWFYWAIAAATGWLILHELLRGTDWKYQATAALALVPFLLRVFLLK